MKYGIFPGLPTSMRSRETERALYSMHVNGNWCITFKFIDGHAYEVDFEDYH